VLIKAEAETITKEEAISAFNGKAALIKIKKLPLAMIEKQLDPITEHSHIAHDDVIQEDCKGLARRLATELP
jgi:hypothetical protein